MNNKTAREMLLEITDFLNHGNGQEAKKLWDVLSAFRGPDNENYNDNLKDKTTAIIRRVSGIEESVLGRVYPNGGNIQEVLRLIVSNIDDPSKIDECNKMWNHFGSHVRKAKNSLICMFPEKVKKDDK